MNRIRIPALIMALVLPALPINAHENKDHTHGPDATVMDSAMSEEMLRLPDIAVTDSKNQTRGFVSRYDHAGPVLISFIYTECDDICGMVRGVMQLVDQGLQEPDAPALKLIAVSVDPRRDTPQVLAEQARQMNASENWDWIVASPSDTPALLSAFGLPNGPIETHESVYLLGDLRTGKFLRISGVPDPEILLQHARDIAAGI